MAQTGTFTGLVVASAINVGTNYLVWGWRLSLGLAAVPGAILLLGEHHRQREFYSGALPCYWDSGCHRAGCSKQQRPPSPSRLFLEARCQLYDDR